MNNVKRRRREKQARAAVARERVQLRRLRVLGTLQELDILLALAEAFAVGESDGAEGVSFGSGGAGGTPAGVVR
jgi:hypothetical protein